MIDLATIGLIIWGFVLHRRDKRRQYELEHNRPARRALHIRVLERATGMEK